MVSMGMGSAVAMKVSMAPRARTVSRDDTESTAPQVRDRLILTETLLNTLILTKWLQNTQSAIMYFCHEGASID